jgi:hypothetical protein
VKSENFAGENCIVLAHFLGFAADTHRHEALLGVADFLVVAERACNHRGVVGNVGVYGLQQLFASRELLFIFVKTVFLFSDHLFVDLMVE